jgi:hypothetical protein
MLLPMSEGWICAISNSAQSLIIFCQFRIGSHQTTAPSIHPMPAVIAMANPPQKVTRIAPIITPAPPDARCQPLRPA